MKFFPEPNKIGKVSFASFQDFATVLWRYSFGVALRHRATNDPDPQLREWAQKKLEELDRED
ncbi:MAG: hypothetical protein VKJ64_11815 [Leptolyngbyaceae bacterium]|nr:hypothetical protein [Leptolyngbyaceae bacterium]